MSGPFYTVAEAARRLKLHERTILRFIRDGRLKATRVGRAYRVLAHDLHALAGEPQAPPEQAARTTTVVDVPDVGPELAKAWAKAVTSALAARPSGRSPMNAEVVFDPDQGRLKILIVGDLRDVADLLGLIHLWREQLRP